MNAPSKKQRRRVLAKRKSGLRFERLEDRFALAGNVLADLSPTGDLSVTGDVAENDISVFIRQNDGAPDQIVVQGNGTTVNGVAEAAFDVPDGGLENVFLNMNKAKTSLTRPRDPRGAAGVDTVDIGGFSINGNLSITGVHGGVVNVHDLAAEGGGTITFGTGNSLAIPGTKVKLGSVIDVADSSFGFASDEPTGSDLNITTNGGNDLISLSDTQLGGDFRITTNAGVDVITLARIDVEGDTSIDTAAGSDQIIATDLNFAGTTDVTTGAGVDTINVFSISRTTTFAGDADFDLGNGSFNLFALVGLVRDDGDPPQSLGIDFGEDLSVNGTGTSTAFVATGVNVAENLSFTSGSGVDVFAATELNVQGDLTINTGSGVDVVVLGRIPGFTEENFIGGSTVINTGNGVDVVVLQGTTFGGPVTISLGAGTDVLVMIRNTFDAPASADGGSGLNTAVFDNTFNPAAPNSLTNFRIRAAPNAINNTLVNTLLSRAFALFNDIFG